MFFIGGIIWFILVCILAGVASSKGRSGIGFFFLGFLLSPLIGFIILALMGENKEKLQKQNFEAGITKKCPFCANNIKREAIVCQFCGKDLPESGTKEIEDTKNAGNIEGTNYVVVDPVDLRSEPILASYNVIALLSTGTKLTLLEKGEKTIINNTEGYWLKVQERFYGSGWCFSGNLTEEKNYIA